MLVRITATPPGEAPAEVRQAWVGLVLPVRLGEVGARRLLTVGVLGGPRTRLGFLIARVLRRLNPVDGFLVDAAAAVDILAERDSVAAAWWRHNAPALVTPGRAFVFHADVCEVVDGPAATPAMPPVDDDIGSPFITDVHGPPEAPDV